jgi:two-component system, chemotaxis family, chemotaxis protein CheY
MQLLQVSASFQSEEAEHPLILVIDDEPAIQDMLCWALQLNGYEPVCTANGQEALEWIDNALRTGRYPAAILLDLFMPVMDGTKFLESLRARWNAPVPIPPTILLTVDKHNHRNLACSKVFIKPFHINDLCEGLRLAITRP